MSTDGRPSTDEGHLGDAQYNQLTPGPDRVLGEVIDASQVQSPIENGLVELMGDSLLAGVSELLRLNHEPPPIVNGRVVQAFPFIGWYKVQVDRLDIAIRCCLAQPGSYQPIGVTPSVSIPLGSDVVVWRVQNTNKGVILGVIPYESYKSDFVRPDFVQQGGNSGFKREKCHYEPLKIFAEEGTIQDFSSGRPMDETNGEFKQFNMHGGGILIDDFQVYLRISEICGVFGNMFDHHLRVAGLNYELQTGAHNETAKLDEAETFFERGHAVYPWEGYGGYTPGTGFTSTNDDVDVQYKKPVGKVDEKGADSKIEILPMFRVKEYGGYLGQGGRRLVMRPRNIDEPGLEKLSTTCPPPPPEYCLFEENVGLDGMYFLRSSKSIHLVKRLPGIHPKRLKEPEAQDDGDNMENYKFSGQTGGGEKHEVGDFENKEDDLLSLKQCAGVVDIHTYIFNFKNLHPFHYHAKDYQTVEEDHIKPHDVVTDFLDFDSLGRKMYMDDPDDKGKIEIDHRYKKVKYYRRESYLSMLDEGSVLLGCGYGSEIRMIYGHLFLSAPGDIWLQAGRSIRTWAGDDIDIRAKNSIDVVTTDKDIRLKAETNMELLAGNGGKGGTIIENRAKNKDHKYEPDMPGEAVEGSGILLRAPNSQLFSYAAEIYLRTGNPSGDIDIGDIVLDASNGERGITTLSREVNHFVPPLGQINNWFGTVDEGMFSLRKADCLRLDRNLYGSAFAEAPAGVDPSDTFTIQHIFGGDLCAVGTGNVLAEGNLTLVEGKGTHRGPADTWGTLSDNPDALNKQREAIKACKERLKTHFDEGPSKWDFLVQEPFYESDKVGTIEQQSKIMFSLRDDGGDQYLAGDFRLAETRWQAFSRLTLGAPGSTWTEKGVSYQGADLFPYPGKEKWVNEKTYRQLKKLTMFDTEKLRSKDRRKSPTETADEYVDREIERWKDDPRVPPQGVYQTIM